MVSAQNVGGSDLVDAVRRLQRQVDKNARDIAALGGDVDPDLRNAVIKNANSISKLASVVTENKRGVSENKKMVPIMRRQHRNDVEKLTDLVLQLESELGNRLIVGRNNQVRLGENMDKNPEFRRQFRSAVEDSYRKTGTLVVENRMATGQYVWINREARWVPAGADASFQVATGTVTTRVQGGDYKTWMIAPPNYKQTIQIVPKSTPVYTSPTVYVDPTPVVPYAYWY